MSRILAVVALSAMLLTAGCTGDDGRAPDNGKTVLVTGATGTQGGAVARELLQRGYRVRGLARDPASERAKALGELGVDMVVGDFDDPASLAAATEGAHGVFAVTDFLEHGYSKEIEHGAALVDAAKAAGVRHFIFVSAAGADSYTGVPHFDSKGEIEEYLVGSGLPYSIVRPVSLMDDVTGMRRDLLKGVFYDPRDAGKVHQWIAARDIGFFVAEAFDKPERWLGRALDIAADQLTLAEYTEVLSRALGLDVHHQQITWDAYGERYGEEAVLMMRWFDRKGYSVDVAALRSEYPNLLTYQQFLATLDWD